MLVDGVNVKDYNVDTLRSKIGVVLQKSELFSGTVAENIRWGCETATDEEVKTAAKIAQAEEFIDGFNDGYDTMISKKGCVAVGRSETAYGDSKSHNQKARDTDI